MADATPKYNIRYPEGSDDVDAQQFSNLANDVEDTIEARTEVSAQHTVSLQNGWQANPNNPLVFERVGDIVYFRGEVYHPSGSTADTQVGTIPAAYRPTFERVGPMPAIATSVANMGIVMIWGDGRITLSGTSNRSTTPGYGIVGSYVREA